MTREEKSLKISQNFRMLEATLDAMMAPNTPIKSVICVGKGGCGKTYTTDNKLQKAHNNCEIDYKKISGKITTMGLFMALYESRHSTSVLLLDDVDVFQNETTLDLLKSVLDTSDVRTVSYITSSKVLADSGVPQSFDYRGKIIFLSNKNLSLMSKQQNALSPHIDALLTRSIFIDLELFTNEEVMIHVENIMRSNNILAKFNINKQGSNMILNWMLKNESKLRNPSLRMPVLMAGLYNSNPYDWEEMCDNLFLEK